MCVCVCLYAPYIAFQYGIQYKHTYMYTYIHIYIYVCVCVCVLCMYACVNTHVSIITEIFICFCLANFVFQDKN